MRRLFRVLLVGLVVLLIAAIGYGRWRNPEKATLDASARAGVPGRFVTLSHGVTHYELLGPDSGRTVVLVHGFSVPYYIWDTTATRLAAAGYRVLRYDVYGRGWSDRPDTRYDGALFDAQLGELLDSLRITAPIDLMGLSFGGFITAHFVTSFPTRVRTLTLVDPVSATPEVPLPLTLVVIGPWLWQTRQVPGMAEGQTSDLLHPERYPTWTEQYRPQMRYRGFGRALLATRLAASRVNFDTLYAGVARTGVPVMLVWGREDQTVPFALSKVIRDAIPAVEFEPVDSARHLPHMEQPRLVDSLMQRFLQAHP